MPKLYCCCTDADCRTYRDMVLKLQTWGIDPTPKKDDRGRYFDASLDMTGWRAARVNAFASLVRCWPTGH